MGDVRLLNGITPQGWEPLQFQLSFAHTLFSSRPLAEAVLTEPAIDQPFLEVTAEAMRQVFSAAVAQHSHMGRSIATVLAEHDADAPELTHDEKVGRNDSCPC